MCHVDVPGLDLHVGTCLYFCQGFCRAGPWSSGFESVRNDPLPNTRVSQVVCLRIIVTQWLCLAPTQIRIKILPHKGGGGMGLVFCNVPCRAKSGGLSPSSRLLLSWHGMEWNGTGPCGSLGGKLCDLWNNTIHTLIVRLGLGLDFMR